MAGSTSPRQFIQTIFTNSPVRLDPRCTEDSGRSLGKKARGAFRMSEPTSLLGERLETFRVEEKRQDEPPEREAAKRLKPIDRSQCFWGPIDIEKLIEEDHPARGIWAMVSQLDLSALEAKIKAVE